MTKQHRQLLHSPAFLVTLSFTGLILSLPPFNVGFVTLVMFMPLAHLVRVHSAQTVLVSGLGFGLLQSTYMYWGANSYSKLVFFLIVLMISLLTMALFYFMRLAFRRFKNFSYLLIAAIWVLCELCINFIGVPYSFSVIIAEYPRLLQTAQWGGFFLVSFLWCATQIVLYELIFVPQRRVLVKWVGLTIMALLLIGANLTPGVPGASAIRASVVQSATHPINFTHLTSEGVLEGARRQHDWLKSRIPNDQDLVVWPETAALGYEFRQSTVHKATQSYHIVNAPDLNDRGERMQSAFSISPNNVVNKIGGKARLIPWVEQSYTPDQSNLIDPKIPGAPAALICYESIFAIDVANSVKQGARMITVLTSDAYAGPSLLGALHYRFSILRAVENHRFVLRAANGGISAIINPKGAVVQSFGLFEQGVLSDVVDEYENLTFFTRHASVWRAGFWVLGMVSLIVIVIRRDLEEREGVQASATSGRITLGIVAIAMFLALVFQMLFVSYQFRQQQPANQLVLTDYLTSVDQPSELIKTTPTDRLTWYRPFFANAYSREQFSLEYLRSKENSMSLPLSLTYVLRSYGLVVGRAEMLAINRGQDLSVATSDLAEYVKSSHGFSLVTRSLLDDDLTLPLLVRMNNNEVVVVVSIEAGGVSVFSPVNGLIDLDEDYFFESLATPDALFVEPPRRPWDQKE